MIERNCTICGDIFRTWRSKQKTCSHRCGRKEGAKNAKPRLCQPLAKRFWAKVDKTPGLGPTGECWAWTGAWKTTGRKYGDYGNIRVVIDGKQTQRSAHSVAYQLTFGPIPEGMESCHNCDWPPCVRPDPNHVWPATHLENMRHAQAIGRMKKQPKVHLEAQRERAARRRRQ